MDLALAQLDDCKVCQSNQVNLYRVALGDNSDDQDAEGTVRLPEFISLAGDLHWSCILQLFNALGYAVPLAGLEDNVRETFSSDGLNSKKGIVVDEVASG